MRKLALILALSLVLCGCFAGTQQTSTAAEDPSQEDGVLELDGEYYRLRQDLTTILLLGLDTFEHTVDEMAYTNQMESDVVLLLVADEQAKTCSVLQLNRDTMTEIRRLGVGGGNAGSFVGQLALAHTYGSGGSDSSLNAIRAVSRLMYHAPIDHYITLTMDAVAQINDRLGGVTVTVLDDFSEVDPTLVQGQEVTLKGNQALTYVQARGGVGDESNLSRMERQRQYMDAFRIKLLERHVQDETFISRTMLSLGEGFTTDCSVKQLDTLLTMLAECSTTPVQSIQGEAKRGEEFMEFYPDERSLLETAIELFYEKI